MLRARLIDPKLERQLVSMGLARWYRGRLIPIMQGGAFPDFAVLDGFGSYAFGDLLDSKTNWAKLSTSGSWICQGTNVAGDVSFTFVGNYRTDINAADLQAFFTPVGGIDLMQVWARVTNPTSASLTGYRMQLNCNTAAWKLQKVVSGTATDLATGNTTGNAVNPIGIQVFGSQISAYNKSGGSWIQLGTTQTDTAITGAGRIGFSVEGLGDTSGSTADDFGGGVIVVKRQVAMPNQAVQRAASW